MARVALTCEKCGTAFSRMASRTVRYCSAPCHALARKTGALFQCVRCGTAFYRRLSGYTQHCSRKCQGEAAGERQRRDPVERFWEKVDRSAGPNGCWPWLAGKTSSGYGQFWGAATGLRLAHRFSWALHNGPIPDGLWVCHDCPTGDNPLCVNPAHLMLGTPIFNTLDRCAKGRSAKGERINTAKLTADQVRELRARHAEGESLRRLARTFPVTSACISKIVRRETWRHVA